eukprot:TRINITY_DN17691_c0_g6_i1.p2 TRINITY_DN17691_c0_g6~~TRINITY_DN17691_c0_g6_i1.p2  ORF type:complete len:103 (-),score=5.50 TRINITY_DN17691_c0_g6_i1:501-809(-)
MHKRRTPLPTLSLYQDQTRPPPASHNNKTKKKKEKNLSPFNIQLTNSHSLWFYSFYMLILCITSFSLCPMWELTDWLTNNLHVKPVPALLPLEKITNSDSTC